MKFAHFHKRSTMLSFSIDSLKLRIPIQKVEIIEPTLKGTWIKARISVDTGEIIEDPEKFKNQSFGVENKGIKTKYLCQKISNGRTVEDYLCILFNSKLLKSRYLEGITSENIGIVYDEMMKQNIVKVSFEDFLNGICTDIDFKADYELKEKESFDDLLTNLDNLTKKTSDREKGNRIFRQKGNYGIEWSKRQFSSNSNPYVKVYHKSIELLYNSSIFYQEYIKEMNQNLVRVEWTLKGKKHAEGFSYHREGEKRLVVAFNDMRLMNLLSLPDYHKYQMFKQVMSKHLDGIIKMTKETKDTLNPIDILIQNALKYFKANNLSLYESVKIFTDGMNKRSKWQYKKKIEELWALDMDKKKYESQLEVYDFLCELTGFKEIR